MNMSGIQLKKIVRLSYVNYHLSLTMFSLGGIYDTNPTSVYEQTLGKVYGL